MKDQVELRFLGTRGSLSACGPQYNRYGGDTTCLYLNIGEEEILLDAGSGLMNAVPIFQGCSKRIPLLLTHAHLDHIIGLGSFPYLFDPSYCFDIIGADHGGMGVRDQLDRMLSPPLWPVSTAQFSADVTYTNLQESRFSIGPVTIDWIDGSNPGDATIYRFSYGDIRIVFCTDFEHGPEDTPRLIDFSRGATLLIYDGQFTDEEYPSKAGWGHSTWREGTKVAQAAGVKHLAITHHHPTRTDSQLAQMEQELREEFPQSLFAKVTQPLTLSHGELQTGRVI